jgi:DNA-binding MarR family transcriptional regulator
MLRLNGRTVNARRAGPAIGTHRRKDREVTKRDQTLHDRLLPYLLARASHIISAEFYENLRRRGVPVRRWRLLGMLWDSEDGLTIGELSEAILVEQSSTTRLVDRAVVEGLVRKRAGATDKRKVVVTISDAGRAYIADLVEEAQRVNAGLAASYDPDKTAALMDALRDLIDHFEARRGD